MTTCHKCEDTGAVNCPKCESLHLTYSLTLARIKRSNCPVCNGSGEICCPNCEGGSLYVELGKT